MSIKNNKKRENIFEDLVQIFNGLKKRENKIRKSDWGYAMRPRGCEAELVAPTNKRGQWKIISGMPGCGKTNLLIDYYHRLIKEFGKGSVAVMSIGERQIEIKEDWGKIVKNEDLYTIASDENMPEKLVSKLKDIVFQVCNNNKYKAVIIDSLSGIYNIIANYSYLNKSGLGAGGLNLQAPDFINVFIIKPLRMRFHSEWDDNLGCENITSYSEDRIIISSLLYGEENRDKKALYESFKAKCDSEIVLSQYLARERIFPAIDIQKCYSRRMDKFCSNKYLEFVDDVQHLSIYELKEFLSD